MYTVRSFSITTPPRLKNGVSGLAHAATPSSTKRLTRAVSDERASAGNLIRSRVVKALSVAIVLALYARAFADPAADAEALAKQGDFVGAAGKYKLAYEQDPRPELICNVGVAYYKAKELPRAQLFLNRCLERGTALDAKFVASVRKVLEAVETALRGGAFTPVDIVVEPASATVVVHAFGSDEGFIGSRVVWLARGKQTLVAKAEGYVEQSVDIDAQGRERQPVKITLQRTPAPEPQAGSGSADTGSAAPPAGGGSAVVTEPVPPAPPIHYERPSKVPAIVATGVSVAALAVAIVSFQRAHDKAEVAQFALGPDAYEGDKSTVGTWNTVMVTGVVVSVASAGLAGYLWSRAFRSPSLEMQATGSSIAISGRW
jgi:hypothetical protein